MLPNRHILIIKYLKFLTKIKCSLKIPWKLITLSKLSIQASYKLSIIIWTLINLISVSKFSITHFINLNSYLIVIFNYVVYEFSGYYWSWGLLQIFLPKWQAKLVGVYWLNGPLKIYFFLCFMSQLKPRIEVWIVDTKFFF